MSDKKVDLSCTAVAKRTFSFGGHHCNGLHAGRMFPFFFG